MITIRETIVSPRKKGMLEPTYVRYRVRTLQAIRLELVRPSDGLEVVRIRLRPQFAALYGTNRSPRDRMRHQNRWAERKTLTARYTIIDPRER